MNVYFGWVSQQIRACPQHDRAIIHRTINATDDLEPTTAGKVPLSYYRPAVATGSVLTFRWGFLTRTCEFGECTSAD